MPTETITDAKAEHAQTEDGDLKPAVSPATKYWDAKGDVDHSGDVEPQMRDLFERGIRVGDVVAFPDNWRLKVARVEGFAQESLLLRDWLFETQSDAGHWATKAYVVRKYALKQVVIVGRVRLCSGSEPLLLPALEANGGSDAVTVIWRGGSDRVA